MSDNGELEMTFEPDPSQDDVEFVDLKEGEAPPEPEKKEEEPKPEGMTLTKEEYQKLLDGQNSTGALTAGLSQLAETLKTPAQAPQMPMNQPPQRTIEEIEKDLFTPGKTIEEIRKIVREELAPVQGMTIQQQQENVRRFLKLSPETGENYKRFENSIEAWVQRQPPQVRYRPDVYELAYKETMVSNVDALVEERTKERVDRLVAEALEKAGVRAGGTGQKPPVAMPMEGHGSGGAVKPPKTQIYFTAADKEAMLNMSMDPNDKDQRLAYYRAYKQGKK